MFFVFLLQTSIFGLLYSTVCTFTFTLQRTLASYEFTEVVHSSPAITSIMIVVGHVAKGMKYMFTTNQVCIILTRSR